MITVEVIKIFLLATIAFLIALSGTPLLTYFLYHYKLGKQIRQSAPIYFALHKHKSGVPSMGGIMIWSVTLLLAILFAILLDSGICPVSTIIVSVLWKGFAGSS